MAGIRKILNMYRLIFPRKYCRSSLKLPCQSCMSCRRVGLFCSLLWLRKKKGYKRVKRSHFFVCLDSFQGRRVFDASFRSELTVSRSGETAHTASTNPQNSTTNIWHDADFPAKRAAEKKYKVQTQSVFFFKLSAFCQCVLKAFTYKRCKCKYNSSLPVSFGAIKCCKISKAERNDGENSRRCSER